MILPRAVHGAIREGTVTCAFRCWSRPTVRAGGTLTTAVGVLAIDAVDPIGEEEVTDEDARRAGHADRAAALRSLARAPGRRLYRVRFHMAGDDPRWALRERPVASADEASELRAALARLDRASPSGPWTGRVLEAIDRDPGRRAADLAAGLGDDTARLKRRVRRLAALGLTESLAVGYRTTPRYRSSRG